MLGNEQLFSEIGQALIDMETDKVVELAKESIELEIPAYETITQGLIPGMDEVNRLYEKRNISYRKYFFVQNLLMPALMW